MFLFFEAVITRALESVFTWKRGMFRVAITVSGSRKNPVPFVFYAAGCVSCAVARINIAHCFK
jgi:hypothetical protein